MNIEHLITDAQARLIQDQRDNARKALDAFALEVAKAEQAAKVAVEAAAAQGQATIAARRELLEKAVANFEAQFGQQAGG